jgi:hypothetical protein
VLPHEELSVQASELGREHLEEWIWRSDWKIPNPKDNGFRIIYIMLAMGISKLKKCDQETQIVTVGMTHCLLRQLLNH